MGSRMSVRPCGVMCCLGRRTGAAVGNPTQALSLQLLVKRNIWGGDQSCSTGCLLSAVCGMWRRFCLR